MPELNAGLAKRLAEAADSFRDSKYHYFICKQENDYDLHYTKGFDSPADAATEADSIKAGLGEGYEKYGPYKTDIDVPLFEFDSIKIQYIKDGSIIKTEELEASVDAIILSMSAYDKFFQPYYANLYGLDTGKLLRNEAKKTLSAAISIKHQGFDKNSGSSGGTKTIMDGFKY